MKLNKDNINEFMDNLKKRRDYKSMEREFGYFLGLDESSEWIDEWVYWTLERVVNAR